MRTGGGERGDAEEMTDASRPFLWPKEAEEWAHLPLSLGSR